MGYGQAVVSPGIDMAVYYGVLTPGTQTANMLCVATRWGQRTRRHHMFVIKMDGRKVVVGTLAEASDEFRNWIDGGNDEGEFLGGSDLRRDDGALAEVGGPWRGRVSYNGRVWAADGSEVQGRYTPKHALVLA